MEQSAASRELEEFARNVEGPYDDFVLFMGLIPQRKGVDEKLAQYVRDHLIITPCNSTRSGLSSTRSGRWHLFQIPAPITITPAPWR